MWGFIKHKSIGWTVVTNILTWPSVNTALFGVVYSVILGRVALCVVPTILGVSSPTLQRDVRVPNSMEIEFFSVESLRKKSLRV